MTVGATFAQAHQLRPGIALSPAQVVQLTSDIVWLQVTANAGGPSTGSGQGNLSIESLQDTSRYQESSKSTGGSVTFGPAPSASLSLSKTKIDSSYASVTEQSGIRAGDGGFQVSVQGNTDLVGGAMTSGEQAVQTGKNSFTTAGQSAEQALQSGALTLTDIANKAAYNASGYAVSGGISVGEAKDSAGNTVRKPDGTPQTKTTTSGSAGFGSESGAASSTTLAAISGLAGNSAARTGDAETGIGQIFDKERVRAEVNAQVTITSEFGKQASKAVGDYAENRIKEAQALRAQAAQQSDPQRRAEMEQKAGQLESDWGDQGTKRLLAHTLVGGLTGGAAGAAGAAAGTLSAPAVAQALQEAGIEGPLATALTALASTAVGAATGGTAGGAAAFNEVTNNYLNHTRPALLTLSEKEKYERAVAECSPSNPSACQRATDFAQLSRARDQQLQQVCAAGPTQQCAALVNQARDMGNNVYRDGNLVWANSPDAGFGLNVSTAGPSQGSPALTQNWSYQQANNLSQALPIAAVGAGSALVSGLSTVGKIATGAGLGGGFDAAGQWVTTGEIQPMQTVIAASTGALAVPFASTSALGNAALGAWVGGSNAALGNVWYGTDTNVLGASLVGGVFGGGGTVVGNHVGTSLSNALPRYIGGQPINPRVPLLLQNFGVPNPWPARIGDAVEQGVSNAPSFFPQTQEGSKP